MHTGTFSAFGAVTRENKSEHMLTVVVCECMSVCVGVYVSASTTHFLP